MSSHTTSTTLGDRTQISDPTQRALDRISVSAPYFGFTDIEHDPAGTGLVATVAPSPPPEPEVGAIEAAQVARHLAILGSCAAALTNPKEQRHHYLAVHASYERVGHPPIAALTEPMQATAAATWIDKRTAQATMTLAAADGTGLNRLHVTYAVMTPAMFSRLNPPVPLAADAPGETASPLVVERNDGTITGDFGPVDAAWCAGHFPDQPAAPVAVVMGQLVLTARHAMCHYLGGPVAYRVESGTVEATGLAQPGQHLVMEAEHVRAEPDDVHLLTGRALADGQQVGSVEVRLAAIAVPED